MKRFLTIALAAIALVALSCKKDNTSNEPKPLFNAPLTDWSLEKEQVRALETHTLKENVPAYEIYQVQSPWTSVGDGVLRYVGDNFFSTISYCFFNENFTLEVAYCVFEPSDAKTEEAVLAELQKKYSEEYTTRNTEDGGKNHIFKTDFGIAVLDINKSGNNRVIFTKEKYSSSSF